MWSFLNAVREQGENIKENDTFDFQKKKYIYTCRINNIFYTRIQSPSCKHQHSYIRTCRPQICVCMRMFAHMHLSLSTQLSEHSYANDSACLFVSALTPRPFCGGCGQGFDFNNGILASAVIFSQHAFRRALCFVPHVFQSSEHAPPIPIIWYSAIPFSPLTLSINISLSQIPF